MHLRFCKTGHHPNGPVLVHIRPNTDSPLIIQSGLLIRTGLRRLSLNQLRGGEFILGGGWPGIASGVRRSYTMLDASIEGGWAAAVAIIPTVGKQRISRKWCGLEAECFDQISLIGPMPGPRRAHHRGRLLRPRLRDLAGCRTRRGGPACRPPDARAGRPRPAPDGQLRPGRGRTLHQRSVRSGSGGGLTQLPGWLLFRLLKMPLSQPSRG